MTVRGRSVLSVPIRCIVLTSMARAAEPLRDMPYPTFPLRPGHSPLAIIVTFGNAAAIQDTSWKKTMKSLRHCNKIALDRNTPQVGATPSIRTKMFKGPFTQDHAKNRRTLGNVDCFHNK